ncbi:piezo-type mechanosensitive ion channel component 2-like [Cervus canadensis]|nr:piezo-type mechanosensitive ion channel component 2-like [Cervus canadensis]
MQPSQGGPEPMASEVMSRLLFRVLLPCSLLSAVLSRYNVFSVVYLVFLLLSPLLGAPSAGCMRGSTKLFLRAVWATSVLFLLLQGALQVAFVSLGPEGAVWEEAIQHLGVVRFSRVDAMDIVRLLAPDIGMALVGLVTARLGRELARPPGTTAPSPFDTTDHEEDETAGERDSMEHYESDIEGDVPCWCSELSDEKATEAEGTREEWVLKVAAFTSGLKAVLEPFFPAAWKVLVTLLLGAAGMISPSMTSAVYFGAFLGLGSWWACGQALSTVAFSTLCVFMAIFTTGHLGGLYLYQLPFFQNCVPPDDIYARLLGMTALIRTNHTEVWKLHLHPGLSWPEMVNPLILLLSYYTLVLLLQQQALQSGKPEEREAVPTRSPSRGEHQELRSVLWTSGSEEEQVTPLPGGSWQDLPLLHGAPGQCLDLDPPASFVSEKSQTSSGHAASATPTESGLSCASVLGYLAIRHSHVPALITMMVWSICFTGWPGCLLLLWACVIWMARDPCRLALRSAPFLVGYANILIVLSFVAGLRVSREELFPGAPGWLLADLDLKPYLQPCLHLGAKSLCASVFWLLLRLQVSKSRRPAEEEAWRGDLGDVSGPGSVLLSVPATILKSLLVEYWVCLGAALLFAVSFAGKVVVYRVVYILLFLFWVAWYQIHTNSWRRSSKCFWMLVVSYSVVVLFAVYTFQFQAVSGFFNETLGLSEEGLRDLGLQRFHVAMLFAELLLPAALLLAGILHCRCCNEDLRKTTGSVTWEGSSDRLRRSGEEDATQNCADKASSSEWKAEESGRLGRKVPAEEETSDWDLAVDKLTAGFQKFLEMVTETQAFLRRVLETHSIKLVAPVVVWLTLQEPVDNVSRGTVRNHLPGGQDLWAKRELMPSHPAVFGECEGERPLKVWRANGTSPPALLAGGLMVSLQPVDPAEWLGALTKCDGRALPCLKNQLAVLALTTLEVIVSQRQSIHRLREGLPGPLASATSDTVTRAHLDDGLLSALQYFIHFGFYKFGLELCFVAALHTVGQRMDFYALIHIIWLVYLLNLRRRKAIAEVWPRYCGFLVCLIIFQYFLCLGLPPALCKDYPWRTTSTEIHSNLIKWLYLPDYAKKPDANLLFLDFLLLLAASLQWQVFVDENTASMRLRAGDNVEISRELRPADLAQLSPVLNFIFCRSYLDMVKVAVFRYHFWFVLCLVFLAGMTRIHILNVGYLAAFGYFMLQGSHLLLQPAKTILQPWDCLVAYSALVVAVKTFLSVGACVYLEALLKSHCWLVHTFGLSCTVPGYQLAIPEDEACEPPEKEAGILWDAVCLTFLLIQRRIFLSYYHLYVVADLEAAQALASRGAELLALSLREALEHMLQDGSYTFFETDSEEEEPQEGSKAEITDRQPKPRTAFQLAYKAWTDGAVCALRMRMEDEWGMGNPEWDEEGLRRRHSGGSLARRLVTVAQLCGVLGQVLLDDVTEALRALGGDSARVSGALRVLRHGWLPPEEDELEQSDRFYRSLPRLVKLTFALHQAAVAKSETLCYLVIILNHTLSASILSMVLPILSFLWAMISVPRPSKRFWMAAIYYTEATVVVKYFSQFGLFPWTTKRYAGINREKPFSLPNILGVEKRDGSELGDLVQLLALFFHRSTLQGLGLWDQPPCDQAHCKGERKSRRRRRNASGEAPGGGHLRRRADLDLSSQELPLSPPAPKWAFWRRWWATGHRGGPQDPGSRKTWSLLRKQSLRQKQLNRSLLETLEETRKLGVRRSLRIYHSIRRFFSNLRQPPASPVRDVYTLAFLVEVLNLVIVLFGYWAFGKHSAADLAESLSEETVPGAFLVMVLVQFGTMLVDRALYLRKAVLGKCAFQLLLVLGTHLWLFFILPGVTTRRFNLNHVAQTWYLVKCIYFGLSAYQIRHGYPNWILGNCLTKNFSLVNLILFKGFRVVPFLLELRAVIDWMWTNTSLSLSNWTCLEDLYANIFIMKCHQESEKKYPQPPGRPQKRAVKYGLGGIATFALVFLMWFPLVFMSLVKTVGGVTNQPLQVSVKIAINGYETLFSMSAQRHNLVPFSDTDYDRLTQQYALHPSAMQFLADYRPEDIVLAKIKSHASLLWGVSPTDRSAMVQELANTTAICITTSWAVQSSVPLLLRGSPLTGVLRDVMQLGTRWKPRLGGQRGAEAGSLAFPLSFCVEHPPGVFPAAPGPREQEDTCRPPGPSVMLSRAEPRRLPRCKSRAGNVSLVKNVEASGKHMVCYTDADIRDQLVYTLSLIRKEPVMLPGLIPKALRTTEGTEVKMAHRLEVAHSHRPRDVDRLAFFRNATIQLQQLRPVEAPVASPAAEWWMVQEWRPGCDQSRGCSQDLELVIFNDKVSPQSLGFLAGYGIVGLYVSVVMVAAKFIRDHFLGIARSIMYDQLPDVDRVLGLCTDIFLARELGELQLEQELFARLTFLYRSPETMIKWTRQRPPTPCLPPTNPVAGAPVERLEAAIVSSSPLASEK